MKNLSMATVLAFSLLAQAAYGQCQFDYNINGKIGYSKGSFDVKHQSQINRFNKTHNNASRIGGDLIYGCGETTLTYTHHSVIGWSGSNDFDSKKIINTYVLSHPKYGVLTVGKLTTPYKAAGKNGDPFWDTASGTVRAANNFGFSALTRGFTEKSMMYSAPKFGNFQLNVGYSGTNSHGDYHHGFEYHLPSGVVGVQYVDMGRNSYVANGNGVASASRLYGRHWFGDYLITASIENIEVKNSDNEFFYNVSLQKKVTDFGRWAVSYGHVIDAGLKLIDGTTYRGDGVGLTAGAFYGFLGNSEIYLLTSLLDFDGDSKQNSLILGLTYNFSL